MQEGKKNKLCEWIRSAHLTKSVEHTLYIYRIQQEIHNDKFFTKSVEYIFFFKHKKIFDKNILLMIFEINLNDREHEKTFIHSLISNLPPLRASQGVVSMWPCTVKLDEEKSKCAGLAQENGFERAYSHAERVFANAQYVSLQKKFSHPTFS
jgi:hypothetical protein